MRPILFSTSIPLLGFIEFPAYLTFLFIGFIAVVFFMIRTAPEENFSLKQLIGLMILLAIGGLLGSRLLHVFADGEFRDYVNRCLHPEKVRAPAALVTYCYSHLECGYSYLCDAGSHRCHKAQDCFAWLKFWQPGLAYYGGFLFAMLFAYLFSKKQKISFFKIADSIAPALALGLFFGRMGCFLHGCCFGKRTDLPWGVSFPSQSEAWRAQLEKRLISYEQKALLVHPTQLYESLGCFLIFLILYFVVRPQRKVQGQVMGAFLIFYGILRSCCEFFRDDPRGVVMGILSTSQFISLPLVIIGIYLFLKKK